MKPLPLLLSMTAQKLETSAGNARKRLENAPPTVLECFYFVRKGCLENDVPLVMGNLITSITKKLNIFGNFDWLYQGWEMLLDEVPKCADPSSAADIASLIICEDINTLLYLNPPDEKYPKDSL